MYQNYTLNAPLENFHWINFTEMRGDQITENGKKNIQNHVFVFEDLFIYLKVWAREKEEKEQGRASEKSKTPCWAGIPTWGQISGLQDYYLRQRLINWAIHVPPSKILKYTEKYEYWKLRESEYWKLTKSPVASEAWCAALDLQTQTYWIRIASNWVQESAFL